MSTPPWRRSLSRILEHGPSGPSPQRSRCVRAARALWLFEAPGPALTLLAIARPLWVSSRLWAQPVELWVEDRWLKRVQTVALRIADAASSTGAPSPPRDVSVSGRWLLEHVDIGALHATVTLSASVTVREGGGGVVDVGVEAPTR